MLRLRLWEGCRLLALWIVTAKTPAQRKASERQRHKEAGRTEVRGIYAKPADHAAIKAYAAKLARKRGAVPAME